MATREDFTRAAMALDGTIEKPHMDRMAYRVNRIYATLTSDGLTANLKFSPEEQQLKCLTHAEAFTPIDGGWGKQGWTVMTLVAVNEDELQSALKTAWAHAVPKKPLK